MTIEGFNRQLHILFIITQGIRGGAQNHVRDVARHLYSAGYDVQVAVGVEGPLIDELESSGIVVHHIPALVREISPVKDFKAYLELTGLVKRIQPDLITTHSSKAGILGRLVCRRQNIPNVFTAHGWAFTEGISELKRWVYTFVERSAAKWTDRIICVSEYDRKLALDYSVAAEAKLIAVHNGIPLLEDVDLARPDKGDVVNIIMVARFSEQKDHGLLLEAVPNINSRQRFRVQLVGDGEKFDEMMTRAQQMGLENVEFLGNRSDVASLLSQAHIFVLTSNWEGFPLTILEAMQAGLPVVASDVGGVREAVTEGTTGYLIPRGDVQTLTSRLQYLINEPGIRAQMGINARRIFEENFTLDKMMHETIAVYEKVLQDRVAGKGQ
ncbi:MAG: glycosyltransferase family 4 protein [Syntrophomonadaceae bacterium]|jgi:glycosyltransferase involved in cell wall biosynthesis